jgi:hypothetical protein
VQNVTNQRATCTHTPWSERQLPKISCLYIQRVDHAALADPITDVVVTSEDPDQVGLLVLCAAGHDPDDAAPEQGFVPRSRRWLPIIPIHSGPSPDRSQPCAADFP